jgi:hypothetical protein
MRSKRWRAGTRKATRLGGRDVSALRRKREARTWHRTKRLSLRWGRTA